MGCGCGGSNRGVTTATRRDAGSGATRTKVLGGFTWDGPVRPDEADDEHVDESAETEQTA